DFLLRLALLLAIGFGPALLSRGLGVELELDQHGKVIRSDFFEPLHTDEREMGGVKKVIEREAKERLIGVEGRIKPAPVARIEHAARFLEEGGRMAPGHVVEV